MKLSERIRSYKFWVALSAAIVLLLQSFGKAFGFEISADIVDGITMGFCSVLMVLGVVEKPHSNDLNSAQSIKPNDLEVKNQRVETIENISTEKKPAKNKSSSVSEPSEIQTLESLNNNIQNQNENKN